MKYLPQEDPATMAQREVHRTERELRERIKELQAQVGCHACMGRPSLDLDHFGRH